MFHLTLCMCVCQGINSNHAQTARFNTPTSYHCCKPGVQCLALQGGSPTGLQITICTGCCCVCVCVCACVCVHVRVCANAAHATTTQRPQTSISAKLEGTGGGGGMRGHQLQFPEHSPTVIQLCLNRRGCLLCATGATRYGYLALVYTIQEIHTTSKMFRAR